MTLPSAVSRANMYMSFDASGNPIAVAMVGAGGNFASPIFSGSITGSYTIAGAPTLGAALALPGGGEISSGGLLGIGMTPVNAVDITQSHNGQSIVSLLNATSGTAALAEYFLTAGSTNGLFRAHSQGYTDNPPRFRQGGTLVEGEGAGGLQLSATAGNLDLVTNATLAGRIDGTTGGMTLGSPTGGQQGAGTLNATGLYVNGVSVPFTGKFASGQIALPGANATTAAIAHGLGVAPFEISLTLHCVTAELGWSIGDETPIPANWQNSTGAPYGFTAYTQASDATTHLYVTQLGGVGLPNKGGSTVSPITQANWKLIVKAKA